MTGTDEEDRHRLVGGTEVDHPRRLDAMMRATMARRRRRLGEALAVEVEVRVVARLRDHITMDLGLIVVLLETFLHVVSAPQMDSRADSR